MRGLQSERLLIDTNVQGGIAEGCFVELGVEAG